MRMLAEHDLAWTVVRLPRLLDGNPHSSKLSPKPPPPLTTMSYAAAADLIVEELLEPRRIGQAPFAVPA
jgi:hypothetical protein